MKLVGLGMAVFLGLASASLSAEGSSVAPGRWEATGPGSTAAWTDVDLFGETGYASTGGRTLYKTQDSGATWLALPGPPEPDSIRRMSFASPTTGFLATGLRVFRTRDAGTTWEGLDDLPIQPDSYQRPAVDAVEAIPGTERVLVTGWAPTGEGCDATRGDHVIARWQKGRWNVSRLPFPATVWEIEFLDRSNGLMLVHKFEFEFSSPDGCTHGIRTARSFVFLTRDGGRTWRKIHRAVFIDQDPVHAVAMPTPDRIVLGTRDGTILLSNNGGRTFRHTARLQIDGSNTGGVLDAITFGTAKVGYAGTNAIGMWRTKDGGRNWAFEPSPFEALYLSDGSFKGSIGASGRGRAIASGPASLASRRPL